MDAADAGLIITAVALLLCLRRRRTPLSLEIERERNEVLMNTELGRKPQA